MSDQPTTLRPSDVDARPSAPAPKVGDVIEGPACVEPGCRGHLQKRVIEVTSYGATSDVSCTGCGERAFDERLAPMGDRRIIAALLLQLERGEEGVIITERMRRDALNYDLRVGRRGGENILRLSLRLNPYQPGGT